jgi:hypothetical protein
MADKDHMKQAADAHEIADPDAFTADHMTVVSCDHGTIWIRLHDETGKVRAFGCFDLDGALNFSEAVNNEAERVINGQSGSCGSVH